MILKSREQLGGYLEGGVGDYDHYEGRSSIDVPVFG